MPCCFQSERGAKISCGQIRDGEGTSRCGPRLGEFLTAARPRRVAVHPSRIARPLRTAGTELGTSIPETPNSGRNPKHGRARTARNPGTEGAQTLDLDKQRLSSHVDLRFSPSLNPAQAIIPSKRGKKWTSDIARLGMIGRSGRVTTDACSGLSFLGIIN